MLLWWYSILEVTAEFGCEVWWQSWLHGSGTDRAYITIQTWDLAQKSLTDKKTNSGYCDWETQRVCQRDIWFSRIWLWSGEGSHNYRDQGLTQWQGSQVWDLAQKSLTAPNQAVVTVTKRLKRVCVIFGSAEFGCEVWWQSWLQGSGTSDKVCVRDWDLAHQNLAVKGE